MMPSKETPLINGCFWWLEDGTVMGCPVGEPYPEDHTFELTAPDSQEFLDELNKRLGTNHKMDDFAGR